MAMKSYGRLWQKYKVCNNRNFTFQLDNSMKPYHRWSKTMEKVEWVRAPDTYLENLSIQFGKEMVKVASSKFCTTEAIHVFEKVVQVFSRIRLALQSVQ